MGCHIEKVARQINIMLKFIHVGLLALVALVSSQPAGSQSSQSVGTCHSEDYTACALVTAGCAAGQCNGKDNWFQCITDCVSNQHHKECIDCIPKNMVAKVVRPEDQKVGYTCTWCSNTDYNCCKIVGCIGSHCYSCCEP